MGSVELADGPGLRAHDQRLGVGAVAPEADTTQQFAVGDAGGGEEDVLAGDEVVEREDLVEVVAGVEGPLALVVVAGPEAALDGAAEGLEGAGGDDAFGRAADAEEDVGSRLGPGGGDGAGDVAVGNEPDPGAGLPALLDDLGVAVTRLIAGGIFERMPEPST